MSFSRQLLRRIPRKHWSFGSLTEIYRPRSSVPSPWLPTVVCMDLTRHASGQLPTRPRQGRRARAVLIAGTARRSFGWVPRAFWRQVFGCFPQKHWGKCASFVTSAQDLLKTNMCSHTVRVMASYPSPISRSGRRFGVRRGSRSGVVRDVVRRLIARAMALGRRAPGGLIHAVAEGGLRRRANLPSHARSTLAGVHRTPHLTGLPTPTTGASRAGYVRRLRARLAGSSRARLTTSLSLRDGVVRRPALRSRIPSLTLSSAIDMNRPRDRGRLAGSPRARVARARHTVDLMDLATAVTCRMTPTPTNHDQTSRAHDPLRRPCRHQHPRRGTPRQAPRDRAHHLHERGAHPDRRARHDHEEFTAFMAEYRPLRPTRRSGLTMSSATSDT